MRLVIPVYRFRVSPVFDFSTMAMVIEIDHKKEKKREKIDLAGLGAQARVERLKKASVDTLICAGLSLTLHRMLTLSGIHVIHGVVGAFDEVLNAYQAGSLEERRFLMPGCCRKRRRRGNWRRLPS